MLGMAGLSSEALAFELDGPAQVEDAVERPLAVAVQDLLLGQVGGDEHRTVVALGGIEDEIDALSFLAVVIVHTLHAQLIDGREGSALQQVEVGLRPLVIAISLLIGVSLVQVLSMDRPYATALHPEEHRQDVVQDDALAPATVPDEEQALVIGVRHPIDDTLVLRQVPVLTHGAVHVPEDVNEKGSALIVIAPAPAPRQTLIDDLVVDHLRDELLDCHNCSHVIVSCYCLFSRFLLGS